MFLSKEEQDTASRKYISAEKTVHKIESLEEHKEVKASNISNKSKASLYRSLNQIQKFGVIIRQKSVLDPIFRSPKDKQRYLDYAYKIAVKRKFERLIKDNVIDPDTVEHLYFYIDEHTTATNGRYELKENLEQEFKRGTFNMNYNTHFPPIFTSLKSLDLNFCNSEKKTLIRAADIVANRIFSLTQQNKALINDTNNLHLTYLP